MKNVKKVLSVIIMNIIVIGFSFFLPDVQLIFLVLCVWGELLIYALFDFKKRSALLAFLISFFAFLVGREALEKFGLHPIHLKFSMELCDISELLLLISLITIAIAYLFFEKIKNKKTIIKKMNSEFIKRVQVISKYLFYITYIFYFTSIIEIIVYVIENGYLAFYSSFKSNIPYVFDKIGDMCIIAFWIYMATFPTKKESKYPIFLFGLTLFLSLGTGQRFPFIGGLFQLFVYFCLRDVREDEQEIWLPKKMLLFILILIPFLMVGMVVLNQVRFGKSIDLNGLFASIKSFIYQQGVSINVIKREILFENSLPSGKLYSLYSTLRFFKGNIISRFIGVEYYSGNTMKNALFGDSLAHALSYIVLGERYLNGEGIGSCYIAEAYHDLGIIGVVLVNVIYGLILAKGFDFNKKNIWYSAIGMLALKAIVFAPRGNADGFMLNILDLTTWGTILAIYIISKLTFKIKIRNEKIKER